MKSSPSLTKTVIHCSREYALKHRPAKNTALISITTPGQEDVVFDHLNDYAGFYRICFQDTIDPTNDDGPTLQVIDKLYSYLCACEVLFDHIVVHCEYGVSRSAAVALLAEVFGFTCLSRLKATEANTLMIKRFESLMWEDLPTGCVFKGIDVPKVESLW